MYCRQGKHAYRPNPAVLEHLGYRWESSLPIQQRNYQRLLTLVHPPREGFFRREFWNLEGNTGLAVGRRKPCNLGHQADTKTGFSGHQTGHQGGKWLRTKRMVPKKGLEPPHPCGYMDLNHARLPIPPLRQVSA